MKPIAIQSEEDAVAAIREARQCGWKLEIAGAGTKRGFGGPTTCDAVLDCSLLSGVIAYDPEELVMTARAGTQVTELALAMAERNQRLGFEPADWGPLFRAAPGLATIGGIISADSCGSARVRFGAVRDHLLGYRAVNGLAESYAAGGKVVKNVTGFDLPKLMCGALGTLGLLTEVTLRVLPRAERVLVLGLRDVTSRQAFAKLRRLWSSPLDATGLAYLPGIMTKTVAPDCGEGIMIVRIEGRPDGLAEKRALMRTLCEREFEEIEDGQSLFRAVCNGTLFTDQELDLWRITIPPAGAGDVARAIDTPLWLADWAGALIWAATPPGGPSAAQRIRAVAEAANGQAVLLRASPETRSAVGVFAAEPPHRAALTKAVKAAFDPLGLFNPGRMFEGI
jgi:glycolate oxidase FAD binding subunit